MMLLNTNKPYEVIAKYWDEFDETTKAGMILHEVAYREAIARGATNSLKVRRYVGLISSPEVLTIDYPIEILKSGLVYWDDQYDENYSLDKLNKLETNDLLYNTYARSSIEYTLPNMKTIGNYSVEHFNNKNIVGGIKIGNYDKQLELNIYGMNIKCLGFLLERKKWSSDSVYKPNRIVNAFKELLTKPITSESVVDDYNILLGRCHEFQINKFNYPHLKFKFELTIGNMSAGLDMGNTMRFNSERFYGVYVKKGTYNGQDVSGQICSLLLEKDPSSLKAEMSLSCRKPKAIPPTETWDNIYNGENEQF